MAVCGQKGCYKPAEAICHYSLQESRVWLADAEASQVATGSAGPTGGAGPVNTAGGAGTANAASPASNIELFASALPLCADHAEAFNPPRSWTFVDSRGPKRTQLSLAHDADRELRLAQKAAEQIEAAQTETLQTEVATTETGQAQTPQTPAVSIQTAEPPMISDLEDTPLLKRAFRSVSG